MKQSIFKFRMLYLAKFLRGLPPERFDYSSWVGDTWLKKQDLSCGTTACALGWAATIPEFRKSTGLRLVESFGRGVVTAPGVAIAGNDGEHPCIVGGARLFGIPASDSLKLFSRGNGCFNPSAEQVADYLERYTENHEWDLSLGAVYDINTLQDLAVFLKEEGAEAKSWWYKGKYCFELKGIRADDETNPRSGYASDKDALKAIRRAVSKFRNVPEETLWL